MNDDDPLDALKKLKGAGDDPLEQLKALRPSNIHEQFASGALEKRMQGANARDMENASEPDQGAVSLPKAFLHSVLATGANLSAGIPGMEAVQAGARSLASHVGGVAPVAGVMLPQYKRDGQGYSEALSDIRGQTGKIPTALRVGERVVGAAPLARFLPGSAIASGAIVGGAGAALDADPTSLQQRGINTGVGAGIGAASGALLKGAGNVAQRSGLTDAVASGVRTIGKDASSLGAQKIGGAIESVGNAMGTTGAANALLRDRQAILDKLSGSEQSAAQTMLDHVDQYKQQAKTLYDAARQDKAVQADPRVQAVLSDSRVQQAFQVARERLGLGPNHVSVNSNSPLASSVIAGHVGPNPPQVVTTPAPLTLPSRLGNRLPPQQTHVIVDLPTPEELAMTKRLLDAVVQQKFNAPQGINSAEAAQIAPKIDELRTALHDASPAWKDADAFYSHAKNFENAFQKAFGVQQKVTASGLDPKRLKTPEALTAWVDKAQGTPTGIARASGVQSGTASRLGDALRSAPLGPDMASTLEGANGVFQPSPAAAAVRRSAFANHGDAESFASELGKMFGRSNGYGQQSVSILKPWQALTKQNPLATPRGIQLRSELAAKLADPSHTNALRSAFTGASNGNDLLQLLGNAGLLGLSAARH